MSDVGGTWDLDDCSDACAPEWLGGLRANPALPNSALARLLTVVESPGPVSSAWLTWRTLDTEGARMVVASPQIDHRLQAVENPELDVDVLSGLAHDAEPRVRFVYAMLVGDFGRRIPDGVLETLAGDVHERVRRAATDHRELPLAVRARLARDESARVRAGALTPELWPLLDAGVREALLADPDPVVREAVDRLLAPEPEPETAPRTAPELRVEDPDPFMRRAAAGDPDVPAVLALRLAEDPDDGVRLALSLREDLTEEQRSAIAYVVPHGYHTPPRWVVERGHEPEVARRAAASGHVLLRRSIAMQRSLPADVVELLATDEDFFVKLTLCEYCQDAPHELVVEMYAHWHGLKWSFLGHHPNFARPGLARYADHPNPRLRHAALSDPDGGPALVLRLADDPAVSAWAVQDPRLPAGELLRRLALPGSARSAAANPALPPAVMHRLLDLAGVAGGHPGERPTG
ncbi:HEAT repeat domain-containing protein [Streptomyces sp. NPDC001903]|uniref:HEAT repeat domain-containing protein n=1 Tax=Streptomyces sp. NPDC001903 TaxID=3364622 RepID=UPI0036C5EFC8